MPGNGSGGTAVTRSTLRQQIADALRDEVLAGRLSPGQEFTVRQIADQYGVSATPVREALVDLSAQGLLDSDQHRGFKVHEFSVADYRMMVEARALVVDGVFQHYERTGRRHEPGPGPFDVQTLVSVRRRAEEAARAARAGDLDILIGYDLRFWRELSAAVSNRYVSDFLHRLRVQAWVFAVPRLRSDPDPAPWLWSGHARIVDAVTRGDARGVRDEIAACNTHELAWADRLERREKRGREGQEHQER
ncbi:GntR family transcriptional regulator [Streptomyces sp. t39]|uniref:GntR family transcriptional regulator n=1 Tax=Streptomyces sp. t39 TaxID=1828156 RepID=UPI0011CD85E5|nr:GntR family transcriptional regulator [Streptomyces sp. t39]TXS56124.1 GntR family transcriptional regulator [Streptomyces sp. t39]